jgi:hypothetical protein
LTRDQIRELDRVFASGVTAPAVVTTRTLTDLLTPVGDDWWTEAMSNAA